MPGSNPPMGWGHGVPGGDGAKPLLGHALAPAAPAAESLKATPAHPAPPPAAPMAEPARATPPLAPSSPAPPPPPASHLVAPPRAIPPSIAAPPATAVEIKTVAKSGSEAATTAAEARLAELEGVAAARASQLTTKTLTPEAPEPAVDADEPAQPEAAGAAIDAEEPAPPETAEPGVDAQEPAPPEAAEPKVDAGEPTRREAAKPGVDAGDPTRPEAIETAMDAEEPAPPEAGTSAAAEMAVGGDEPVVVAVPTQPTQPPGPRFGFQPPSAPPVQALTLSGAHPDTGPPRTSSERVYATAFLPASVPRTAELNMPSSTNEVREFIRHAALDRGMDPDVAVRVALSEGGLTPVTWTGDHASSFGPFQLHYGGIASGANAVPGLGDAFTAETGLRANDPRTWRQQVEWTLDRAARSGWTPWHGAAAAGINAFDGLSGAGNPAVQSAGARRYVDVPDQFAAQLSAPEAYAACGPVAAVAVARWLGRNPTVVEALATAKRTGWTVQGGMNGISNEKRLLDAMRISARLDTSVDWRHVQRDASSGNPVIVSTPQHYWVIDDFDPASGKYHVGRSGSAYRGGGEWMSAAQIQQFGGAPNGALFVDNPLVGRPSVAAATPAADLVIDRWWEAERV